MKTNNEKHPNYKTSKLAQSAFIIEHYAGPVSYTVTGFLEKNKNTLQQDLVTLCLGSKNSLVSQMFVEKDEEELISPKQQGTLRKGPKVSTISFQFKVKKQQPLFAFLGFIF